MVASDRPFVIRRQRRIYKTESWAYRVGLGDKWFVYDTRKAQQFDFVSWSEAMTYVYLLQYRDQMEAAWKKKNI